MKWILIIGFVNGGIATADFQSRELCEAAAKQTEQVYELARPMISASRMFWHCAIDAPKSEVDKVLSR